MTSIRRFHACDLFRFNDINLDALTETYNMPFYEQYLAKWPSCFFLAESWCGRQAGYMMGKIEGTGENWHGHVTAVTVAADFRRIRLADFLMQLLERTSDTVFRAFFVDLYVRISNAVAINMYKKFGYSVYRQVIGYYSGDEDAYDMRKAMSRDVAKKSIIPLPHPVNPSEID